MENDKPSEESGSSKGPSRREVVWGGAKLAVGTVVIATGAGIVIRKTIERNPPPLFPDEKEIKADPVAAMTKLQRRILEADYDLSGRDSSSLETAIELYKKSKDLKIPLQQKTGLYMKMFNSSMDHIGELSPHAPSDVKQGHEQIAKVIGSPFGFRVCQFGFSNESLFIIVEKESPDRAKVHILRMKFNRGKDPLEIHEKLGEISHTITLPGDFSLSAQDYSKKISFEYDTSAQTIASDILQGIFDARVERQRDESKTTKFKDLFPALYQNEQGLKAPDRNR